MRRGGWPRTRWPGACSPRSSAGFAPPSWAYPANPPDYVAPADKGIPQHVPDSNVALTLTQIRDLFTPPDWFPQDHPSMPPGMSHEEHMKQMSKDAEMKRRGDAAMGFDQGWGTCAEQMGEVARELVDA